MMGGVEPGELVCMQECSGIRLDQPHVSAHGRAPPSCTLPALPFLHFFKWLASPPTLLTLCVCERENIHSIQFTMLTALSARAGGRKCAPRAEQALQFLILFVSSYSSTGYLALEAILSFYNVTSHVFALISS